MAGIAAPNTVDVVGQSAAGEILVAMVEDRPWGSDPKQPTQLLAKVNAYASFILNGGLARQYPDTVGHPVSIVLSCAEAPTEEISAIVEESVRALKPRGIGFRVEVRK